MSWLEQGMAENGQVDKPSEDARDLFLRVEHGVYLALGGLLAATALLALAGAGWLLIQGVQSAQAWNETAPILEIIDRLLFVLMLVEILHTVRVSIRSGALSPEPFLIVGLIASIRRVLVITLKTSEVGHDGGWSAQSEAVFRSSMIELGVLGMLILVMVVSIFLLKRTGADTST